MRQRAARKRHGQQHHQDDNDDDDQDVHHHARDDVHDDDEDDDQEAAPCSCIQELIYLPVAEKDVFWVGSSLEDIRAFPTDARCEAGHQLYLVQNGLDPDDWRPMSIVGHGVYEIRIHTAGEYRVFYIAKFAEGVYVLHAFEKKSQKTSKSDIDLAKSRLRDVMSQRKGR